MKRVSGLSFFLILALLIAACGGAGGGEQTPGAGEGSPGGVGTQDLGGSGEEILPTDSIDGIDGSGAGGAVATISPTIEAGAGNGTPAPTSDASGAGSATQAPTGDAGGSDSGSAASTPGTGSSGSGGNDPGSATQPVAGSTPQGNVNPGIPVTGVQGSVVRLSELIGYSIESVGNLESGADSGSGSTGSGAGSSGGSSSATAQPTSDASGTGSGSAATQAPTSESGGTGSTAPAGASLGTVQDVLIMVGGSVNGSTSMNSGAGDMGTTATQQAGSGSGSSGSGAGDMGSVGSSFSAAGQQGVVYLIVNGDASFGFASGRNLVAVPWSNVVGIDQTRGVILVNVQADRMQGFPTFGENDFPDMSTEGWDSAWRSYWGEQR